jgi:ribonuclease G
MKHRRDQQAESTSRMRDGLKRDRAKTHMLPISQLGLMEMTRQRHSESVHQRGATTTARTAKAAAA